MPSTFYIIIALAYGYWCYKIAESKGRDKGLAFILGFLFGLLAVIGYALVGRTPEKEAEYQKKIDELKTKI